MHVLLTGVTGYVGRRILEKLIQRNFLITALVRDPERVDLPKEYLKSVRLIKHDLTETFPQDILLDRYDCAYYLIHSMSNEKKYAESETLCAKNFKNICEKTGVKQVIYLSGISNAKELSTHLQSRLNVENELKSKQYALTVLRAGIIIGSGSASFEIIRDLVEKLPIMIAPKWVNTKSQPIAIRDVLSSLENCVLDERTYNKTYDIGGPNVLTYKEMLLQFAEVRNLKRHIYSIPVMTPNLSSYWLYFITTTSFRLANSLVKSMKVDVTCKKNDFFAMYDISPISYRKAVELAFDKIEQNSVISSWKDAISSGVMKTKLSSHVNIPQFGCFKDLRKRSIKSRPATLNKIWTIGGKNGWYGSNFLWKIRGFLDKLVGGVGLRRGRTSPTHLSAGDPLDFWRVLYADKEEGRLLLFAEMKVPGEAWLEFKIVNGQVYQEATFRPKGLLGRLYWYSVAPFHSFVFSRMLKSIAS